MEYKKKLRLKYTVTLTFGIMLSIYNAVVIPKNGFAGLFIAIIAGGLIVNGAMNLQKLMTNKQDYTQGYYDAGERLKNLKKLIEEGLITEKEFEKKRQEIIEKEL